MTLPLRLCTTESSGRFGYNHRANFEDISCYAWRLICLSSLMLVMCVWVDSAWDNCHNAFMSMMSDKIPWRGGLPALDCPSWLTTVVKRSFERRDLAHRAAKRNDCPSLWSKFRRLRNKAVTTLRKAKRAFFQKLSQCVKEPKAFWGLHHSITSTKQRVPSMMRLNDEEVSDIAAKAELLNKLFVSVFAIPGATMELPFPHLYQEYHISPVSVAAPPPTKVLHILATMRPNVATGPDEISSRMLRHTCAHNFLATYIHIQSVTSSR